MLKKLCICALSVLALSACGVQTSDSNMQLVDSTSPQASPQVTNSTRFKVEIVGKFNDDLAYNHERGVYILHDTVSGKDFVGVSGVGISEIGSHLSGKIFVEDER